MSDGVAGQGPLHVAFVIDSMDSGGAQRQVAELAIALPAVEGIRTTILTYHAANFYESRLREAGVRMVVLPRSTRPDPRLALRIRRWLRDNPTDVVHSFLEMPSFWSWLATRGMPAARRPSIVAAERSAFVATTRLAGAIRRRGFRGADAVTVNAELVAGKIAAQLGIPREQIHYLPNGIDLATWDAALARSPEVEPETGRFHLALVGGLRREKNHRLLFEALRRIPREEIAGWRVSCVGAQTGGARTADAIRSDLQGLESCVRFLPAMQTIAAFMGRLDALVLPSLYEGFPNVVLEAMSSGLPVVATRVGDVPNLVEHGRTGYVVPPGDAGALADALLRLSSLPAAERAAMGRRGRERVERRFQMRTVVSGYAALYRSLQARRRGLGEAADRRPHAPQGSGDSSRDAHAAEA